MLDEEVAELASRQYGLLRRAQAFDKGATNAMTYRRLAAGRWLQLAPGVYGVPGWPWSWHRSLWLAHLDVGPASVVSHEAAAAVHRFASFRPGPVVLTVPHGDHERPCPWTVHQATDLRSNDVVMVDGLPVTTKARTLFDLAKVTRRGRLELAVDDAHVSGACRVEEVMAVYAALRRRGKPGMKMLGAVLRARGPGYVPPGSVLERRLLKVLDGGGLPAPVRQYPLPWRPGAEARVDFAYPQVRVLVEADGRRWHSRMDQMATDRRRDREALNHGWRPYRFVWEEIIGDPDNVAATVRDALFSST